MGDKNMIKDKIIQMDNGKSYYILDDVEYNGSKYVISLECDLEKDKVNENDYFVMKIDMDNNDLSVKIIDDDSIAKVVVAMLLNKLKNN